MADDIPANLVQLASNAMKPEHREAGPGEVGPTTNVTDPKLKAAQAGENPMVTLDFDEDLMTTFWDTVEQSDQRVKQVAEQWDILLDDYRPIVVKGAQKIKNNGHFRNVHTKLGSLFYKVPDLVLEPDDPGPGNNEMPNPMNAQLPLGMPPLPPLKLEDIISVKQAVLKKKMGRDGIKGGRLMDELLFDVLAWSGLGCCKVAYTCVHKDIPRPKLGPPPGYQPPPPQSPLGLSPQMQPPLVPQMDAVGQPIMENVSVPIYKNWTARRFSPKKIITNADLYSSRYEEDSTLLGFHFYMSPSTAMKELKLTEDEVNKATEDDKRHKYDYDNKTSVKLVHGMELWVKLSCYTDELHPQAVGQLVLVEGIRDRPIIWRRSPDQDFDEMGQLTPDSLDTLPIKVLTIRDLADSAFPDADSAFTAGGVKELTTWRRQSILMRDANIGKFLVESDKFDDSEYAKLTDGEVGTYIKVNAGELKDGPDKVVAQTTQLHQSQDDYRSQELIKRELDETLGIGSNQSGAPEQTVRSATETATVNQAVAQRNEKELGRSIDFYLDIVRAVDQLLMRYATANEWVQIAGDAGARRMQVWNAKLIQMKCLYDIAPDSQLRLDSAQDFRLTLQFYNVAARDPLFNRAYVLRRLSRMRGFDPSKVVLDPAQVMTQPPHGGGKAGSPSGNQGGPGGGGAPVDAHLHGTSGQRPNQPGAANHREAVAPPGVGTAGPPAAGGPHP